MNGGAQFWAFQFVDDAGLPYAGAKVAHFVANTTDPLDVWEDEARTIPAAQPVVADANGLVLFYGDGLYRLAVYDADDVPLYTWDYVRISAGTGFMWQGDYGTAYPAASATNKGQLFALVDGNDVLQEIGLCNGTAFRNIAGGRFPSYNKADLPAAPAGALARVTDDGRGLWMTNGSAWGPLAHAVNVMDFGAEGDGVHDDSLAVAQAIAHMDGGILYFPPGRFKCTSQLAVVNKPITFRGAGIGATTIYSTVNGQAAILFAKLGTDVGSDGCGVEHLTVEGDNNTSTTGVQFAKVTHKFLNHVHVKEFGGLNGAGLSLSVNDDALGCSSFRSYHARFSNCYQSIMTSPGTDGAMFFGTRIDNTLGQTYGVHLAGGVSLGFYGLEIAGQYLVAFAMDSGSEIGTLTLDGFTCTTNAPAVIQKTGTASPITNIALRNVRILSSSSSTQDLIDLHYVKGLIVENLYAYGGSHAHVFGLEKISGGVGINVPAGPSAYIADPAVTKMSWLNSPDVDFLQLGRRVDESDVEASDAGVVWPGLVNNRGWRMPHKLITTTPYTPTVEDCVLYVDPVAGTSVVNLPETADVGNGMILIIRNRGTSGSVTVNRSGIDDQIQDAAGNITTRSVSVRQTIWLISDADNQVWRRLAFESLV